MGPFCRFFWLIIALEIPIDRQRCNLHFQWLLVRGARICQSCLPFIHQLLFACAVTCKQRFFDREELCSRSYKFKSCWWTKSHHQKSKLFTLITQTPPKLLALPKLLTLHCSNCSLCSISSRSSTKKHFQSRFKWKHALFSTVVFETKTFLSYLSDR